MRLRRSTRHENGGCSACPKRESPAAGYEGLFSLQHDPREKASVSRAPGAFLPALRTGMGLICIISYILVDLTLCRGCQQLPATPGRSRPRPRLDPKERFDVAFYLHLVGYPELARRIPLDAEGRPDLKESIERNREMIVPPVGSGSVSSGRT
jgi:hypothetical protein